VRSVCIAVVLLLPVALVRGSAPAPADAKLLAAFRAECAAKAKAALDEARMAVPGKEGWLFYAAELRHVSAGRFWGEAAATANPNAPADQADPLPAIVDFKKQLDAAGIELLLVPVPPKAVIYPEAATDAVPAGKGATPRLDPDHVAFYELLRKEGVKVVDLVPEYLKRKTEKPAEALYCKGDTHWSGHGLEAAATRIIEETNGRPWLKDVKKTKLESEVRDVEMLGDLAGSLNGAKTKKEKLRLRFVGTRAAAGAALEPLIPDPASPVLLLGDSHLLIFHAGGDMHAQGAGLADQLALGLGFPLDVIGVRGSGATPARVDLLRQSRADPDYLKGKKLVIWCFTAREFTEAPAWQKVPLR
jgi:acetyltransferase AlgX (SGNH hydrolase-like protein)